MKNAYHRCHPYSIRPLCRWPCNVRADDLGAVPIKALMQRNPSVDWEQVDDVIYGCANQAGEDRNVGRMSALLAGLPYQVPATTINRLCGSSLDAIAIAAVPLKQVKRIWSLQVV